MNEKRIQALAAWLKEAQYNPAYVDDPLNHGLFHDDMIADFKEFAAVVDAKLEAEVKLPIRTQDAVDTIPVM